MANTATKLDPARAAAGTAKARETLAPLARELSAPPRRDLYSVVHKGLRAYMADVLVAVGRTDPRDGDHVADTLGRVRALLHICRLHLHEENQHVHPALEARRPGSSATTARDHLGHEEAFEHLEAAVRAVERSAGREREVAVMGLYRGLALFVAENFVHMHTEETSNQAALWATYSDEEIAGIHRSIVASIAPPDMMAFMRWMVPSISPAERAGLLAEMRQGAPREAFEAVLAAVRPHLAAGDWDKLARALDRAPAG